MTQFANAARFPQQIRWLGRIRRLFAVLYAGAALAIDYGVLPWGKKSTLEAIKLCMNDAMDQLIVNFGEATPWCPNQRHRRVTIEEV